MWWNMMNYDYDKSSFLHLVISSLKSEDSIYPAEQCALLGVSNVPLLAPATCEVKKRERWPLMSSFLWKKYWNQQQKQQPTYSCTMTLIRNVLDSRVYPQHWLHPGIFNLPHTCYTKLSSRWTATTQPKKPTNHRNSSFARFIPYFPSFFPCFSRFFPCFSQIFPWFSRGFS